MQVIRKSKSTSHWRSVIWVIHYSLWNYWMSRKVINSVKSIWPLKPLNVLQVSMKAAMDSYASDAQRYIEYSKSSYHIVSEIDYVAWLTTTNLLNTLALQNFTSRNSQPSISFRWSLMLPLRWEITQFAKNWIHFCKWADPLRCSPVQKQPEFVAIDIVRELPECWRGFQYIVVKLDRFNKLVQVMSLWRTRRMDITQ